MVTASDLLHYFMPVDLEGIHTDDRITQPLLRIVNLHKPHTRKFSFEQAELIILGIGNHENNNRIRQHLYGLSALMDDHRIADLGNLKEGKSDDDTFIGITDVVASLGRLQKTVIVLGDHTRRILPLFHGLQQLEHPINLTVADSRIDLMADDHYLSSHYLNALVSDPDTRLFDFVHLGYQNYLCDATAPERLEQLWFEHWRLGSLREDLREAEPVFRNTDFFAFALSAIRWPEAPGTRFPSANGFTGEEACQISRYAGLSDKLTLFSLLDYVPESDLNDQTAAMAAQIVWHFLQGFSQRRNDYPFADIQKYQKYIVTLPKAGHDLTFFKSPSSNRWWMEVPWPDPKYPRSLYIACSNRDYQKACEGEIPERWWNNYQKII